jgi:hypothetical protein
VNTIITILSLADDVSDPEARRLLKRAALRLARLDWDAEAPAASPERRRPVILPITPSPAGRAGGAHSRRKGRP